jgi:hypothetical protein
MRSLPPGAYGQGRSLRGNVLTPSEKWFVVVRADARQGEEADGSPVGLVSNRLDQLPQTAVGDGSRQPRFRLCRLQRNCRGDLVIAQQRQQW